jgi:F-type H+-transporting ATPase subunit b
MITIDITLLIHVINMIVLMVVLNAVMYKPIQSILLKRRDRLDSLNNDVEQFEQNARHRQKEVDKKMHQASTKAKAALDGARAEAQAAGAEKLAAIRSEADTAKEKQMAEIHAEIDAAKKELQDGVSGFANDMAVKILGRSLEA